MTGVTTTSTYPTMSDNWAHRELLKRAKPRFNYNNFGQVRFQPQKETSRLAFRRQENLDSDPVVLTEGVTPAYSKIDEFDVEVELKQYGKVVALSDKVLMTVEDDTALGTADNLNQTMWGMLDKVTRDTIDATATQIDCTNGVNGNATATELTETDVELALDYLWENDAEKMTPTIEGLNRFGTAPVDESFWSLGHTDLRKDIKALASFTPTSAYPAQDAILQAEYGATDEIRWVLSSQGKKDSSGIYSNHIIGSDAYGHSGIDEVATEMIIKELGAGDDALNQRQTMGFKAFFGALILNDAFIVNLRASKSA